MKRPGTLQVSHFISAGVERREDGPEALQSHGAAL